MIEYLYLKYGGWLDGILVLLFIGLLVVFILQWKKRDSNEDLVEDLTNQLNAKVDTDLSGSSLDLLDRLIQSSVDKEKYGTIGSLSVEHSNLIKNGMYNNKSGNIKKPIPVDKINNASMDISKDVQESMSDDLKKSLLTIMSEDGINSYIFNSVYNYLFELLIMK